MMKLNIFRRSMIFATFFGSSLCIALIVASLGTTHWVDARARSTYNPVGSEGRINFGLFEGHKELNLGFGWRYHEFSVRLGNHPSRRWAWAGCAGALCGALICGVAAATLAALASAARARCSPRPIIVTNTLAVLFIIGAIAVWLTEYYLRLQHNVMSDEDLSITWSSDGMAELGVSFWLVVAAAGAAVSNTVLLCVAAAEGADEPLAAERDAPALQEKTNGAIMLY